MPDSQNRSPSGETWSARMVGRPQGIEQQRAEMLLALRLGLLVAVLGTVPAGWLFVRGQMNLLTWLAILFGALVSGVLWWLSRKTVISRYRLYLWRGMLLTACVLHAGAWLHVGSLGPLMMPAVVVKVMPALALLPLLYWPLGLAMALLAWLLAAIGIPLLRLDTLAVAGVAGIFGAAFVSLLRRQRDSRFAESEARKAVGVARERQLGLARRLKGEHGRLEQCQKELVQVRELAEEVDRAKTEFLATISHEIRTPLNGILPILDMLQDTRLDSQQRRYVKAATASSRHLLRIINDILDFARAESGKLQLESIEINLRDLMESVVDLMRSGAQRKGLRLNLDIASDVPAVVRGDPIRLRQILANLLNNAVKFTEQGQVDVRVEARRQGRREVELYFAVSDTGIGLSGDQIERLFQSFTQADASTTRRHGGTGLGLAICRRLVDLMGGRIGAKSTLGRGSTFWFLLPMRRSMHDVPTARSSLQGVRIMSAITDAGMAQEVSSRLAEWGVREERVQPAELLQRLRDTAKLGKSWAVECLLLDNWGSERSLVPVLREIRKDPMLRNLGIVLLLRQPVMAERLQNDFSTYVLSGVFSQEALRRLLNRLFDVSGNATYEGEHEDLLGYLDLNVEQETVLSEPNEGESEDVPEGTRARLLLVEDNPVNLGVMRGLLGKLGVSAIVAENGRQALEQLAAGEQVDMILMDCQMPIMDGYEATRQWRAHEQKVGGHVPVVALTANAMPGDRERCFEAGMDDYLPKPVSIDEMDRMLKKWLEPGKSSSPLPQAATREVSAPADGERRMLERGVISELREVMGPEFGQLVQTFLDTSPDLVDQLRQAERDGDVEAMVLPAHSLKSGSANMGAMYLSSLARETEMAARRGDLEAARKAAAKVPEVFIATCTALRSELG